MKRATAVSFPSMLSNIMGAGCLVWGYICRDDVVRRSGAANSVFCHWRFLPDRAWIWRLFTALMLAIPVAAWGAAPLCQAAESSAAAARIVGARTNASAAKAMDPRLSESKIAASKIAVREQISGSVSILFPAKPDPRGRWRVAEARGDGSPTTYAAALADGPLLKAVSWIACRYPHLAMDLAVERFSEKLEEMIGSDTGSDVSRARIRGAPGLRFVIADLPGDRTANPEIVSPSSFMGLWRTIIPREQGARVEGYLLFVNGGLLLLSVSAPRDTAPYSSAVDFASTTQISPAAMPAGSPEEQEFSAGRLVMGALVGFFFVVVVIAFVTVRFVTCTISLGRRIIAFARRAKPLGETSAI